MTLHELETPSAVSTFLTSNANTIICFSATWCGPCKRSKPDLIAMAQSYAQDVSKDVKFGIIYEHKVGNECVQGYGVRAFPTYLLFIKHGSQQCGKVEGANMQKIRMMIEQAGCQKDFGKGNSLGGSGDVVSQEDARALRLQKLAANNPWKSEEKQEKETVKDEEMKDVQEETTPEKTETEEENTAIDPTASLDKEALEQLTSTMGFSLVRAQKGLLNGNNTLEGAIEWITSHQDDADIDEPIAATVTSEPSTGGQTAISYKCIKSGKIFSNMAALELHAKRTGYSDFEECTQEVKPLTPEEKAAKIEQIKRLLKAKRTEREMGEKKDNVEREKQRRFMGKEMTQTREMMEVEKRKRDAASRKKAKQEEKRERDRLLRELAKDKAERMANKGKLSSKLGVDGYQPDGIQYDVSDGMDVDPAPPKPKKTANVAKIDDYIQKVSSYRAGGDGKKCLKILLAYVGNVADKPEEEKFKTINMENKVYKTKVKPFVGAKNLLLAVGFQPSDEGGSLVLNEDADPDVLIATKIKLEAAMEKY